MQDFEKELSRLKLAAPPNWLRARAMVAAQNAAGRVARRRKYMTLGLAAAASVMIAVGVGYRIFGAFGLLAHGGSGIQATGVQSFAAPGMLEETANSNAIKTLQTQVDEQKLHEPKGVVLTDANAAKTSLRLMSTATVAESTTSR